MALINRGKNRWELQVSLSPTMKQRDDLTVIHVDIDPAEIDKNIPSSIGLAGSDG